MGQKPPPPNAEIEQLFLKTGYFGGDLFAVKPEDNLPGLDQRTFPDIDTRNDAAGVVLHLLEGAFDDDSARRQNGAFDFGHGRPAT